MQAKGIGNMNKILTMVFLLVLSCSAGIYLDPSTDVTNGLIAHWKLDEMSYDGTAGEVKDSSGNGNNGTGFGKVITNPGKIERSGSFNGNSWISLEDCVNNLRPEKGTFSAWIKTSGSQYQFIYRYRFYGQNLSLNESGNVLFEGYYNITLPFSTSSPLSYNDGAWHLVTGTSTGYTNTLYIDGIPVDYNYIGDGSFYYDVGASYSAIGRSGNYDSEYFNGLIDDIRIYNRALSPEEVKAIYNARPREEGAVAVYGGNKLISNPKKKSFKKDMSE